MPDERAEATGDGGAGPEEARPRALPLLLVLAAAAALLFSFLGRREICNPDEPREAETAREAAEGHWTVAPEVNGFPFRERPPLYYWMVAAAFDVAGEPSDASAKAASALLGVVAVFAGWLLGETLVGRGRGWLCAALLLGTPYLLLRFRTCTTDAGLTAFTTLSLALFFAAWRRESAVLAAASGVAAGLAFLCKGLLGLGIPAVVAASWLAWRRDFGAVRRARLWIAVPVGLALVAPWLWAVYRQAGPEWLHAFFVDQHLGRLGADADHAQPFWFYVRILWVALPLTPLAILGLLRDRAPGRPGGDAVLAGALWVGSLLLVLSAIGGKRNVYLMPLLPGAALAAAGVIEGAVLGRLTTAGVAWVHRCVAALEGLSLQFLVPWRGSLRTRAGAAAIGLAALTVAADAFLLPRFNHGKSGYALSRRISEVAAGRPLVTFRVGEGDIGQFAFALRRRLPAAWQEPRLRRLLGDSPAVVLTEKEVYESAARDGELSPGLLASLRRLEEGSANHDVYLLLEWPGTSDPSSPPAPPELR